MSDNSSLGNRMKLYEAPTRAVLPRRSFCLLRVDGRSFHQYLRKADRPFDMNVIAIMDEVTKALCAEITGTVFAYTQSDEISLLIEDFGSIHTQPWFGGVVNKMVSISAALASVKFNEVAHEIRTTSGFAPTGMALFDSRVFTISDPVEVANYYVWRQKDWVRNSISMAAHAHFSQAELHKVNTDQMQEKLWQEKGINWAKYPDGLKRGRICIKVAGEQEVTYTDRVSDETMTVDALRSWWEIQAAPHFTANPDGWLAEVIPPMPSLAERRPA
ncbi:tRNA(His) guanylyltransferase Thg1 family protein [Acrocarpospora sp. B8E8]|uniref:tRNA(His) guanylyltransferase Thg1 family protein n=1 Tax=Acrocarpospora sp. B8E8 TaxID=3153572 RepID=UPI00325E5FD3